MFLKCITSFAKFCATILAVASSGGAPSASARAFDVCEPWLEVPWQMPCVGAPLTQKSTGLGLPRALQLDAQGYTRIFGDWSSEQQAEQPLLAVHR